MKINIYCPVVSKQVSYKDFSKPWIDGTLKADIKRRHNLLLFKRSGKISTEAFNRYRNYVTNKLKNAKINYFNYKFNCAVNDMRKTWSLINDIIQPNAKCRKDHVNQIIKDCITYTNQTDISNALNDFFVNIGRNINDSIPASNLSYDTFLQGNHPNSFFLSPLSPRDVRNIIHSLKNKPCSVRSYSSTLHQSIMFRCFISSNLSFDK